MKGKNRKGRGRSNKGAMDGWIGRKEEKGKEQQGGGPRWIERDGLMDGRREVGRREGGSNHNTP